MQRHEMVALGAQPQIVSWIFLGAGPVAPPEGWPSGSEKGESHFLETSCFHAALIFLRALFSFQTHPSEHFCCHVRALGR